MTSGSTAPSSAPGIAAAEVGVVIPFHGDPAPVRHLVDSLLAAPVRPGQIIVSDDCSPTPFGEHPGATVIRRETNGGFGSAVNTGAAALTGTHMLVLNSDVELPEDFLADFLTAAAPWQPAVTAPAVVTPAGEPEYSARRFPTIGHQFVEWLAPLARWRHTAVLHRAVGHDLAALGDQPAVTDWLVGSCLLIPLAEFRQVGGFHTGYFMNAEEVDLQLQLRGLGIPAVRTGFPTVVHEGGGSTASELRRQWVVSSRYHYARRWGHPRLLRAALAAATGINTVFYTAKRVAGRDVAPLRTAAAELRVIGFGRRA